MNRVLLKFPLQLELRNNETDRYLVVDIRLLRLIKAFSTVPSFSKLLTNIGRNFYI